MTWQLVYTVSAAGGTISIPHTFTDSLIIVEAICPTAKPSWHEAGWLYQLKDIPNVGITRGATTKTIYLERQEVKFERLTPVPYTLKFVSRHWIPDITLNFWENDMSLYPINPPESVSVYQTATANTTTVATTATVSKVVSANAARKGLSFYNPGNGKLVYLDVVNTVSSTNAKFAIPAGTSLVMDINWVGDMYAVSPSGTSNLQVTEYL